MTTLELLHPMTGGRRESDRKHAWETGYHAYLGGVTFLFLMVLFLYYLLHIRDYFVELHGSHVLDVKPIDAAMFFVKYFLVIVLALIIVAFLWAL